MRMICNRYGAGFVNRAGVFTVNWRIFVSVIWDRHDHGGWALSLRRGFQRYKAD